jgi:hypothetical protein
VGLGLFSVDPCGSRAAEEDSWIAGKTWGSGAEEEEYRTGGWIVGIEYLELEEFWVCRSEGILSSRGRGDWFLQFENDDVTSSRGERFLSTC